MGIRIAISTLFMSFACLTSAGAEAQNVSNGQALFTTYCQVCHTANPATAAPPYNLILTAANNPAQITFAFSTFPEEMGFLAPLLSASDLKDIAAYLATFATPGNLTSPVVEFYNAGLDHYFISINAQEIQDLDSGVHPGWARTGLGFNAFTSATGSANPVCRFYIPPGFGDSHFFSGSPQECADTHAKFPALEFESPNVFYISLPDLTSGVCPFGTIAVFRLWNGRADSNHRYTTDPSVVAQMLARGYVQEGYGPSQTIMCAPQ